MVFIRTNSYQAAEWIYCLVSWGLNWTHQPLSSGHTAAEDLPSQPKTNRGVSFLFTPSSLSLLMFMDPFPCGESRSDVQTASLTLPPSLESSRFLFPRCLVDFIPHLTSLMCAPKYPPNSAAIGSLSVYKDCVVQRGEEVGKEGGRQGGGGESHHSDLQHYRKFEVKAAAITLQSAAEWLEYKPSEALFMSQQPCASSPSAVINRQAAAGGEEGAWKWRQARKCNECMYEWVCCKHVAHY